MKKRLIYIGLFFWLLFFSQFAKAESISFDTSHLVKDQTEISHSLENSDLFKNRITKRPLSDKYCMESG